MPNCIAWSKPSEIMQPLDVEVIGEELAIRWPDASESYLLLERLRRACPCAGCQGERDVMGHLHRDPDIPLTAKSFKLVRLDRVGSYAVQPVCADGHATGLYSFDYLRRIAAAA